MRAQPEAGATLLGPHGSCQWSVGLARGEVPAFLKLVSERASWVRAGGGCGGWGVSRVNRWKGAWERERQFCCGPSTLSSRGDGRTQGAAGQASGGEGRPTPGSQRVVAATPCDSWGLFSFPLVWPMNEIF